MTKTHDFLLAAETAVLVIDMQNDFCNDEGRLAQQGGNIQMIKSIIPGLNTFLNEARKKGAHICWIKHINSDLTMSEAWLRKRSELGRNKKTLCEDGTWGSEIVKPLSVHKNDIVIKKHRHGAFYKTDLDIYLRTMKIKNLVITGISTNACVDTTIREAYSHDYFVYVPVDLVATSMSEFHEPFLENANRYFATLVNTEKLLNDWAEQKK